MGYIEEEDRTQTEPGSACYPGGALVPVERTDEPTEQKRWSLPDRDLDRLRWASMPDACVVYADVFAS